MSDFTVLPTATVHGALVVTTISLDHAVVYDTESFPNVWTLTYEMLYGDAPPVTYEISEYRDDRQYLLAWFAHLYQTQTPMIGFKNESYDYAMIHFIYNNPQCTVADIYAKNQSIIGSSDRFGHIIWPRDRFAPQIDLMKLHHMDNRAKSTSLKALQINMRSRNVMESPVPFGQPVNCEDVDRHVIPYNVHDVQETKRFAHISMDAIKFRVGLTPQFGIECLSWNDTKIGEKMLEHRLGDDVCYDRSSGRKQRRQTIRSQIALRDIIFPYIRFNNPEFQRVHKFMMEQTLTPDDITDPDAPIKTKGVFSGLTADVGGITFHFGTGGVHASIENQRVVASDEWLIRDIDVAGLYPNIAIQNGLAPAHLGEAFITEYAKLPQERKQHAKGTVQNAAFKLAANGAYGKSNSKFSFLYDPQFTMQITINGQLMLCMLAEWLLTVPTVTLLSVNTDGVNYRVHRSYLEAAKTVEKQWQDHTKLILEDAHYNRIWQADVNTYVWEGLDGKLKIKGRLWYPDPLDYEKSISTASPPAWHKDLSAPIIQRAAVTAMVHGIDPETFIRAHSNPFDFMLRGKVDRSSQLWLGDQRMQQTMRYYVAREGAPLVKLSPPPAGAALGAYKRKNGVSQAEYERVMRLTDGEWHPDVCTGNKSRYEERRTAIQAGWLVAECNDASTFRFDNVDYNWYVNEARKLIIT